MIQCRYNVSHLYITQNEHIFHQIYNILDADESRIDHINTLVLTEGVRDSLAEPPPIPMYLELDPCPAYGMIDGRRTFR